MNNYKNPFSEFLPNQKMNKTVTDIEQTHRLKVHGLVPLPKDGNPGFIFNIGSWGCFYVFARANLMDSGPAGKR